MFEAGSSSKLSQKKRKHMQQKSVATRLNEGGVDFSYEPYLESKSGNQPFILNGKRTSSTFSVGSFPTKRVRTATRQRGVSPYPSGIVGPLRAISKTDASSEDTSSFLDDQSSLHGGSMSRKNLGVETTVDFERQLPYDGNEISSKSKKKKKKPKHLGYKNSLNLAEPGLLVPGKALVVLVHDMGPNWELVSDAINNTLQFKVKEVHDSCFSVFRDQWKRIF
ncbi:hypothetical protein BHE74_00013062 [Ensete ventricosum]|nr:hypothetical protein BHE74_00013062 [Ensete ventricosum]RZR77423.1 hypothetical protein BHM03_00002490 [Ensete ventricosum]